MTMEQIQRCKDRTVEMIYVSSEGKFSKRRVKVLGITNQQLYGYCYLRKQTRSFLIERVLAWQPA